MICIFLFTSKSTEIPKLFTLSNEFQGCGLITYDGKDWINVDFGYEGIIIKTLNVPRETLLLRHLRAIENVSAIVKIELGYRNKSAWSPLWIKSCNELYRSISGIDIGFTFNPKHLYTKLMKYDGKRNYIITQFWRRSHGIWDE